MNKYYTAEKETRNFIECFSTMTEALAAIKDYKEDNERYEVEDENHMTYNSLFGNHIKECREKAGLTPDELLDALRAAQTDSLIRFSSALKISRYEENTATNCEVAPDLSKLEFWEIKCIANACGCTIDDLIK